MVSEPLKKIRDNKRKKAPERDDFACSCYLMHTPHVILLWIVSLFNLFKFSEHRNGVWIENLGCGRNWRLLTLDSVWCTTKCHYQKSGRTFLPPPSLQSRQLLLKDVVYPWTKGVPKELIRFISGLVSTSMRRIVSIGQNLVIVLTSSLGKSEKSIKILFVETVPPLKYPSTG